MEGCCRSGMLGLFAAAGIGNCKVVCSRPDSLAITATAIVLIILGSLGVHNIIPMGTGAGWAITIVGIVGLAANCIISMVRCLKGSADTLSEL